MKKLGLILILAIAMLAVPAVAIEIHNFPPGEWWEESITRGQVVVNTNLTTGIVEIHYPLDWLTANDDIYFDHHSSGMGIDIEIYCFSSYNGYPIKEPMFQATLIGTPPFSPSFEIIGDL